MSTALLLYVCLWLLTHLHADAQVQQRQTYLAACLLDILTHDLPMHP